MEKVIIVGGGLSGLCLAHNLLRQGWDVQVYEREETADMRGQGYRLTIKPVGFEALQDSLPPTLYQLVCESSKKSNANSGFIFADSQLDPFIRLTFAEEALRPMAGQVDRKTLRQCLLVGLESRVHWGKAFASYAESPAGVAVTFSDGSSASADLLVAADGIHSAVRRQRFPAAEPTAFPVHCVFGKTLFDKQAPTTKLQRHLETSGMMSLSYPGANFFCVAMRFGEPPNRAAVRLGVQGLGRCPREDYVMWAVTIPGKPDPILSDPVNLHLLALQQMEAFHQDARAMVREAEVLDTIAVTLRCTPEMQAWAPSRVALIGDAIHAMPPFGANGCNTALRDVKTLADSLRRHKEAGESIEACVGEYEAQMRVYSQQAIREAVRMMSVTCSESKAVRAAMFVGLWIVRIVKHPSVRPILLPLCLVFLVYFIYSWF